MFTYQHALVKLGKDKIQVKIAHETWLRWGEKYHVDQGTGEHIPCANRCAFPHDLEHESHWGHRPNMEQSIDVIYHQTPVVTIHPNGCYTLRTGGWHSRTTRKRLEDYSPVNWIYGPLRRNMGDYGQCGAMGYHQNPREGGPWTITRRTGDGDSTVEFREGMTVDNIGRDVDHITDPVTI